MLKNIWITTLVSFCFWNKIKSCFNPLVFTFLSKIWQLNVKIDTFLTLLGLCYLQTCANFFWGEAYLTVCYLVNRMLSSVLQDKIPYSILYSDIGLFSLPPKFFASLFFVYNHIPHKTKLDSKSLKEKFLCLLQNSKMYKFFCPSIG